MMRVAIFLLLIASAAWAHGDAEWIMRSGKTAYCCGPEDCGPLEEKAVRRDGDGWVVEGHRFKPSDPDVFPSQDMRFWVCRHSSGAIRCFFYPAPGA